MNIQMVMKLAIVGVTIVGVFVLAALGKIEATDALHDVVLVVGGLTVALGISGGISNGAAQLVRGQSPDTGPAVVVMPSKAPPAPTAFKSAGFAEVRLLAPLALLGVLVFGVGATCTPGQAGADLTIGLNAAICVIRTISEETAAGTVESQAIADAVVKCGVTAAQAAGVLAEHRKALALQGCTPKPVGK